MVSHHPPIMALMARGKNYLYQWTSEMDAVFTGLSLKFKGANLAQFDIKNHGEQFTLKTAQMSLHNLVMGKPYMDLGDTAVITNSAKPSQRCEIDFFNRGWFSKDAFKLSGRVFEEVDGVKHIKYEINGHWNDRVLVNKPGESSYIAWKKREYPDQWEWQYGMTTFTMQLNYLPEHLKSVVAPTDARFNPSQRALENGDLRKAAYEKDRYECIQRAQRKYHEVQGTNHVPAYFEPRKNPANGKTNWFYNNKYFEHDRKHQAWEHLPPVYPAETPPHLVPYMPKDFTN